MGGKKVVVTFLDGSHEEVFVRQFRISQYDAAFLLSDNEQKLNAFAVDKDAAWLDKLAPESYEELNKEVREVNGKGFFSYAARQWDALLAKMNSIKPEAMRLALERGSKASPLGLVPRRG